MTQTQGLIHANGDALQVYGEATLILNLGGGLVVLHAFLMADLAADSHLLNMDFLASYGVCRDLQVSQLETAGHSYQMVHESECLDNQPVNLACDVTIPAGHELMSPATLRPQPDRNSIFIGAVTGFYGFTEKFAQEGLVVAHSTVDTQGGMFPGMGRGLDTGGTMELPAARCCL